MIKDRREEKKEYYQKNKEKMLLQHKKWRENNKEKIKEQDKEYRLKNKERDKERKKNWTKTEYGKMRTQIARWKNLGIRERYENEYEDMYKWKQVYPYCMNCCKLFKSTFDKCLDHNHNTGFSRAILCRSCNVKRRF